MKGKNIEVVIITGLSGAGKTQAADWFEDNGYYCIDNMPPALIKNFLDLAVSGSPGVKKAAFVADVRGGDFFEDLEKCIDDLKNNDAIESRVLFIEASVETIVRRYNESRRYHPLSGGRVAPEVIESEAQMLAPIRRKADVIIDSTHKKVGAFRSEMDRVFLNGDSKSTFNINILSFGYKYGVPVESDIVFDMRFIPNPYYLKSLRNLTGNNKKVRDYVLRFDITRKFLSDFDALINELIPGYIKEGKYHINIGIGCTGGHHRSVVMANELGRIFEQQGKNVNVRHRDMDLELGRSKK